LNNSSDQKRRESNPRRFLLDPTLTPQVEFLNRGHRIDVGLLTAERVRSIFLSPPEWSPEQTGDRVRFSNRPITPAAVLVPIVMHTDEPTLLLTERAADLQDHAGQIAFPGGRKDDSDPNLMFTALREAQEEIGLDPQAVEIVGTLPEYQTGSNYLVTPIVALVEPRQELTLQRDEVADAFEVPLQYLFDPINHQRRSYATTDPSGAVIQRGFYAMPWQTNQIHKRAQLNKEYFIWGATAAMIRNLYLLVAKAERPNQ
jgi:8-oxo-dGTP pyrophosphatase MutT (NUDIX family)